ncbi:MAG: hypothetical protein Q8T09_24030 [Candidatus Melainabacteria bacterium]|nr:hypothetical protein [Candidatus Melainabacteria bacterium]
MDNQSGNDKLDAKTKGGEHPQLNSVDILQGSGKAGQSNKTGDQKPNEAQQAGPGEKVRLPVSTDTSAKEPPIGVALLQDNETIVLHLKGKKGDLSGEAEVEYKLGDKLYDDVYKHLGGIKKGETKLVPAWQDDATIKPGQQPARQSTIDGPKAEQEPGKDPNKEQNKDQAPKPGEQSPGTTSDATTPGASAPDVTTPGAQIPDVVVPASTQFIDLVNDTYAKMSPEVRDLLAQDGTVVTPTRRITDALPELKGQKPRGWPPELTWDAVDGAYSPSRNLVVVAEETRKTGNQWVKSNRTEDVTRHEIGHATDYAINKLSDSKAYTQAYEADIKAMPANISGTLKYFLQSGDGGKEEACAEGIAVREGGSTSGKTFELGFPKSIAAINDALLLIRAKLPAAAINTTNSSQPNQSNQPNKSSNPITDVPPAESGKSGSQPASTPEARSKNGR